MSEGHEVGELLLTLDRGADLEPRLIVERADPCILISTTILERVDLLDPRVVVGDGMVIINGTNRTVKYRMLNLDHAAYAWHAHRVEDDEVSEVRSAPDPLVTSAHLRSVTPGGPS